MESLEELKLLIAKWEAKAREKAQQAKEEDDREECNYQLGKSDLCEELLKEIDIEKNEEEKATSKKRDKQSV